MARRKNDAERGPFGAWAYNTRTALDLKVEAVIAALPTTYHPATLRKAEGGTVPPGLRMWRELGNLYMKRADERHVPIDAQPRMRPEPAGTTESPDALVAALTAQTEAINALVGLLRPLIDQAVEGSEGRLRAVEGAVAILVPQVERALQARSARRETAG